MAPVAGNYPSLPVARAADHHRGMNDGGILYSPHRERLVSSNAWAFLHALAAGGGPELESWPALLDWAAANPAPARQAVRAFAGQPHLPAAAAGHVADILLFLDIRPDDVLLVADAQPLPWSHAGNALRRYAGPPGEALEQAVAQKATVLAVPAAWLDTGSFQRRQRLDLRALRTIVTLGGPLSAEAAGRIYAWVKSDILLLARAGDRVWGDPLGPVLAKPAMAPGIGSLIRR